MKRLPSKPSELLKLALTDLELCEADPKYGIDMNSWHIPQIDGTCLVCLAGSVMAKSLNTRRDFCYPGTFPENLCDKLDALNDFRIGFYESAFAKLNKEIPASLENCFLFDELSELEFLSKDNRPLWKLYMCDLIGILEAEGL